MIEVYPIGTSVTVDGEIPATIRGITIYSGLSISAFGGTSVTARKNGYTSQSLRSLILPVPQLG